MLDCQINFLIDRETKEKLDRQGIYYERSLILRRLLQLYLDGKIHVDLPEYTQSK